MNTTERDSWGVDIEPPYPRKYRSIVPRDEDTWSTIACRSLAIIGNILMYGALFYMAYHFYGPPNHTEL